MQKTTVLIRKINKWHKFHATLTNNLINFSIPNQPNVFAKIVLSSGNSNIEILKKSTLGCISITNKKVCFFFLFILFITFYFNTINKFNINKNYNNIIFLKQ